VETASTSLADVSFPLPSWRQVLDVVSFQAGYNTSVVVFGVTVLGIVAGVIGCFAVLRKRSLIGDALAHSALPGIAAAFLIGQYLGVSGKNLEYLLFGAACSGVLGMTAIQVIASGTRLTEDTAIAAVLSVFFGLGIVLLSVVQAIPATEGAGLQNFIYGQTAAIQLRDAQILLAAAVVALGVVALLFKELRVLCFDAEFGQVVGASSLLIEVALLVLIAVVTIIGLQSVGMLLVVALLIIPATAARFWTERLTVMVVLSAAIGGISGFLGATSSAVFPRLPAGAIIVLTAGGLFVVSMFLAPKRGIISGIIAIAALRLRIAREHFFREMYEYCEANSLPAESEVSFTVLRSESDYWFLRLVLLPLLRFEGHVSVSRSGVSLRGEGIESAKDLVRRHRLWEAFISSESALAPTHVDYSADYVEHVLSPELVAELERRLIEAGTLPESGQRLPSLHPLRESSDD
jgi:manganese/zinc/iron transport system permease protein